MCDRLKFKTIHGGFFMTTLTNSVSNETACIASTQAGENTTVGERKASRSDVDRFEAALNERQEPKGPKGGQPSSTQSELSSLFSALMGSQTQNPASQMGHPPLMNGQEAPLSGSTSLHDSSLQELTSTLVERILVSDPKYSSGSEVRLLLGQNNGPLSGSEIILRRDLEGMLAVEINCRNRDQFKKYVELRSDLTEALDRHEKSGVNLIINEAQPEAEAFDSPIQEQGRYGI